MPNIVAANVTVTMLTTRKGLGGRNCNRVRLAFGDGALTYPAGGIPLTKGTLGCPNVVESMSVVDQGVLGYSFVYDQSAEKLVVLHQGTHTHDIFLRNNAVADAATTRLNVGANAFSSNTGSNVTVTGLAAALGSNGGVVATVPGALVEASAVAIVAQTIEVEVIGW